MGKVTRDIKQYQIYTLYAVVKVVVGKEELGGIKQDVMRSDRIPVAVFDDMDLLEAYMEAVPERFPGQKLYQHATEWREMKPAADQFSLPFNPDPKAEASAEEKTE